MEPTINMAIRSLIPNPPGYWVDAGIITAWDIGEEKTNIPQPSQTDIDTELARLITEYDANQYQRDRAVSFPTWQEQMDMQYWDQVNGTTTWKDAIAKVKSDNPKE